MASPLEMQSPFSAGWAVMNGWKPHFPECNRPSCWTVIHWQYFSNTFQWYHSTGGNARTGVSCHSCLLRLLPSASCSSKDFPLTCSPGISCHSAYTWSTQLILTSGSLHCSAPAVYPTKSNRESTEHSAQLCSRALCRKGISEDAALRSK